MLSLLISLATFGILPGNYSGITMINDTTYAVVDDKNRTDGFSILTLRLDPVTGKILHADMNEAPDMSTRRRDKAFAYRDCEGVAYCDVTNTVFVSGEEDQRIVEYTLQGSPTGRELNIPAQMSRPNIHRNLGFEALAYDASQRLFWTTTEATLPADGKHATLREPDVANRLRITTFATDMQMRSQYAYLMDKPRTKARQTGSFAHGVPSITALPDGSLLVLERELLVKKNKIGSYCQVKIYRVWPKSENIINEATDIASLGEEQFMKKELVTKFTTHLRLFQLNFGNYEGMCLGPRLADGRQTLLLIADSQNGSGNQLFHLKDYLKVIIL